MNEPPRQTGLLWLVKWYFLLTLLVFVVDIFCVFVLWSPNGSEKLESVFQQEITYLDLNPDQVAFLVNLSQGIYESVFVSTGIDGMVQESTNTRSPETAHDFINVIWPVLETATLGLKLFSLRIGILILSLPFLAVVTVVAMSDGFVGWYLRRTGGERESGFIYHRAKRG
ncbi:MAG: DUF4400 domain-containing protein, partial [Gammaproteobacteria bacterium]|nr:DUF4400 domain-containing protein [Gammaproteobacteria bacterium]